MRTSEYFLSTTRESPSETEVISHKLMHRAGLIFKTSSGLYNWMPLGLKVLRKVEKIVREEMNKIGALECSMICVQPSTLWEESGRWQAYGSELLRIKDRHDRDFCFAPTHEEVITDIVRSYVNSYKQLPLTFYQIQTKFRDEVRPRFGVMRAREFLMKDAYSFNLDEESLDKSYQDMYLAYKSILFRLGLDFRVVAADSGQIGGSFSHEFQVLAEAGEDVIAISDSSDYAANLEMASSLAITKEDEPQFKMEKKHTPNTETIKSVAEYLSIPEDKCLKAMIVHGINHTDENNELLIIGLRGDHQLNEVKAQKHPKIKSPLTKATDEEVKKAGLVKGYTGVKNIKVDFLIDRDASVMNNFCMGALEENYHFINVNWNRDVDLLDEQIGDFRYIVEGDKSPDGKGYIKLIRGIEIGHVFKLGDKYSKAMNLKVSTKEGSVTPVMGCYGIGVSRLVAAAIEQNHDDKGIIWPKAMSPFSLVIASIGYNKNDNIKNYSEKLYNHLKDLGYDILLDNRDIRIGEMLSDLEIIGIPHVIIISERNLNSDRIEYKDRKTGISEFISIENIDKFITDLSLNK